ncbi:MAG TPA: prolipoprotein diacylglyceryl transferase [Blastocatellia bacterium]|nr:prolipoprotein diacylglyceryl transferase [Blastocatellia bacterium]
MLPELFKIPFLNIPLSTYGLLLAIAFITALYVIARLAERDGLPKNRIYDLGLYILASALIGAKVLMIFTEPEDFGNIKEIFSLDFWRSGGVYFGGFIIALIVSVFLMRRWHLPWRKTADAFAPGIAIGHAIGRLGCFSAGCCWGKPTTSFIGIKFTEKAHELTGVPISSALVPTQLIEAAANLLIFIILLAVRKKRVFDGQVIFAYGALYSVVRFTVEFWRDDPRGSVLGISTSQFISLIIFPASLALMLYFWRRSQSKPVTGQRTVASQAL